MDNRCDQCGKFTARENLHGYTADDGATQVSGQECFDCLSPSDRERFGLPPAAGQDGGRDERM